MNFGISTRRALSMVGWLFVCLSGCLSVRLFVRLSVWLTAERSELSLWFRMGSPPGRGQQTWRMSISAGAFRIARNAVFSSFDSFKIRFIVAGAVDRQVS